MSLKYGYDYELEMTLEDAEAVDVFTNEAAKPENKNCTWFYQIFGYVGYLDSHPITEESGNTTLCDCTECKSFGVELYEFFSIYLALKLLKENKSDIRVSLWVTSEKFLFDENEGRFSDYDRIYKCAFLRTLGKDLSGLLRKLEVETFHYEYVNKDIIPVWF